MLLAPRCPPGAPPAGRGRPDRDDLGLGRSAQYPYLLPQTLTIEEGAAAGATLTGVLIVFGFAVVLVVPALGLLYVLTQRGIVEEERLADERLVRAFSRFQVRMDARRQAL